MPLGEVPIFERGRIEHLALERRIEEGFWLPRVRLREEGAATRPVTDVGILRAARIRLIRTASMRGLLGSAADRLTGPREGGLGGTSRTAERG